LLRDLSARAILSSIADAAERWIDADFPPRVRATAAIERRLHYTVPVIDYALHRLFVALREDVLEAAIAGELGSVAALDGFVQRAGRPDAFARGVDRVAIVSSDTTIGVAIVPAIYALCAKCDVTVKDRSDDLVAAFFSSLAQERPEFRDAARAQRWTGGTDAVESDILGCADTVVAFGNDDTLRAIRAHLRADARFVPFGHRMSVGFVDVAAIGDDTRGIVLDGIARDTLLYDGEGCLSLHALFVAGDATAVAQFTADLAAVFATVATEFPAGTLDPQRAVAVAAYRKLGAFRAAGGQGAIFAPDGGRALIALDPSRDEPPPLLPRVLPVYPVGGPDDAARYMREKRLPVMAIGVADPADPAMLAFAEAAGAVRIAPLGEMQSPPPGGHHGGSPRIADFVRWIDREW